jgi:hypothetical protein
MSQLTLIFLPPKTPTTTRSFATVAATNGHTAAAADHAPASKPTRIDQQ